MMVNVAQRALVIASLFAVVGCDGDLSDGGNDGGSGNVGNGTTTNGTGGDGTTGTGGAATTGTSSGGNAATTGTGGVPMTGCEGGPLAQPIAGCTPTPLPSTGDLGQDCVDRINQFRWECQCLPPLQRWTEAETCSDQQSQADQSANSPHGNFGDCGENAQNTCPNWGSTADVINGCLQSMWDEGPGEPFVEHGHYINMSSQNYTKVACGFSTSGNGVWANQNFRP